MPENRNLRDGQLIVTSYLPAIGATNYTDSFDLGHAFGQPEPNVLTVECVMAAAALHVDPAKSVQLTLQDSDDDVTFANTNPLIQGSVPGVASTGSDVAPLTFRLPPNVKRYIRIAQTVPAGDGDLTAVAVTTSLLF